jgi:hypothetical protein
MSWEWSPNLSGTSAGTCHAGPGVRLGSDGPPCVRRPGTLPLHFGDRAGLLTALVEFMDESLGVEQMAAPVFAAQTGEEMLERTVDLYAALSPQIDRVAQILEAAQYEG